MTLPFTDRRLSGFPEAFWLPLVRRDGLKLATYRHSTAQPKALMFFFHGWNSHSEGYADTAARLVEEGCECLAIDYVGSGRSQGLHGYTGNFIEDMVMDGVAYIHKVKSIYDPNLPVFILGHSIGGAVCINISLAISEVIKGMILLAPALGVSPDFEPFLQKVVRVINWFSPFIEIKSDSPANGSRNPHFFIRYESDQLAFKGKVRAGTAVALLDGLDATSNSLLDVTTPFVLVQGGQDKITDADKAKLFYEGAPVADKELWFYEPMLHGITWEPEYPEILERIVKWVEARS